MMGMQRNPRCILTSAVTLQLRAWLCIFVQLPLDSDWGKKKQKNKKTKTLQADPHYKKAPWETEVEKGFLFGSFQTPNGIIRSNHSLSRYQM